MQQRFEFKYDVYGNKVEKKLDSNGDGSFESTERYALDGWKTGPQKSFVGLENWDIWGDHDGDNVFTTGYMRGNIVDQAFARWSAGSTSTRWLLTDRLSSIRDVLDDTGALLQNIQYDGWGNVTNSPNNALAGRFRYTSREYDVEIDLQYNRARWYNGRTGKWISQDPLGFDVPNQILVAFVAKLTL